MSADNRTISTDALTTLGTIITDKEKRDAIHLFVIPMVATQTLKPGQDVGVVPGGAEDSDDPVGIVDPFLKMNVKKGQMFWLVIFPRKITSLRHVWSHPAFDDEIESPKFSDSEIGAQNAEKKPLTKIEGSERWIQNFSYRAGMNYDRMMSAADRWFDSEDYTNMGENETYKDVWGEFHTFWENYEIVRGVKVKDKYASFFSCSC